MQPELVAGLVDWLQKQSCGLRIKGTRQLRHFLRHPHPKLPSSLEDEKQ